MPTVTNLKYVVSSSHHIQYEAWNIRPIPLQKFDFKVTRAIKDSI